MGSGYRPYEFEGLGRDFDNRRDIVEESIGLMFDAWHRHRWDHKGKYYKGTVKEPYEMLPHPIQMPHPPLYMAGGTDRSIGYSGRNGFGLMLSTLPSVETLAAQTALYKRELATASAERRRNPAAGEIDIARWVYTADTDSQARAETEEAIVRHISHFGGSGTGGYLGSVSEKGSAIKYDDLVSTLLHGSAETVIARLREMQAKTGMTSLLLHYPPYYGREKTMKSLKLFAERVIPAFRPPARRACGGVTAGTGAARSNNALGALFHPCWRPCATPAWMRSANSWWPTMRSSRSCGSAAH